MADFKVQQFNNHSQNFCISDNELLGAGTPLKATTNSGGEPIKI